MLEQVRAYVVFAAALLTLVGEPLYGGALAPVAAARMTAGDVDAALALHWPALKDARLLS